MRKKSGSIKGKENKSRETTSLKTRSLGESGKHEQLR